MLFRLKHPELSFEILCVVSSDGCLFLKAIDVARIRGNKNPGLFAAGVSNLTAQDLVYRDFKLPASLAKTRLLSLDSAKRYLKSHESALLDAMFSTDYVIGEARPTVHANDADTLYVVKRRSDKTFSEFFKDFKMDTMMFLDRAGGDDEDEEFVIPVRKLGNPPPRFVTLMEGKRSYCYELV